MIRAVLVLLAACAGTAPLPTLHTSVAGKVPLAERARLVDAIADGDSIVCVTYAGNLVRYDAALRFAGDAVMPTAIASLSPSLLAVTTNGEVVRVDKNLVTTQLELVEGGRWASTYGDKVVVFVDREDRFSAVVLDGEELPVPYDRLATYGHGRPQLFHIAGDTLWWGISAGEWGGAIGRVDLKTGATRVFDVDPPRGFIRAHDRVLAYGGLGHLSTRRGYIAALDGAEPRMLWKMSSLRRRRTPPEGPITALVPQGDRYFATVRRDFYEVSGDLQRWTKRAALPSHAVALVALGDAVVIATTSDGLLVWRGGVLSRVAY